MKSFSLNRLKQLVDIVFSSLKRNKWRFLLLFRRGYHSQGTASLNERLSFLGVYGKDYACEVDASIQKEVIIKLADDILNGSCSVLGCKKKLYSYLWDSDIKTGFQWKSGKYYTDYVLIDLNNQADVKVPWEISRGHQLLVIAQAYIFTNDKKYSDEVQNQILSWIAGNPLMRSINWTCSMEVAIRAVNWMYALLMIKDEVKEEDAVKIENSLYDHGFFIINNLEKHGRYSANHYFSDVVGLLFLGQLFHSTSTGKQWYDFALQEFYYEIRTQFLPSGFHYERSVSYHRLMTELMVYTLAMLRNIGEVIPADIAYREKQVLKTIENYIKPSGLAPAIGDEDNGRFLPFIPHAFHDHKYVLDYAKEKGIIAETDTCLALWEDVGMAVVKKNGNYLFLNNAGLSGYPSVGKNGGGHTHCDLLSFEMATKQGDVIIDPGTYTYTSNAKKRNEYRSTRKHNTIMVDSIDQYDIDERNMFRMCNTSIPGKVYGCENDEKTIIGGSYIRKIDDKELYHKRLLELSESYLELLDEITLSGTHKANSYFHLAEDCSVEKTERFLKIIKLGHTYTMSFEFDKVCSVVGIDVVDDTISPSYGIEVDSKTIVVSVSFTDNLKIKTIIDISA